MTTTPKPFLITGIPGTGKTTLGDNLAEQFGFVHYDLEKQPTLDRLAANPTQFIASAQRGGKAVVTWGFLPEQSQISIVLQFKNSGFKLIWLDGNRPAALREFIKRATVPEICFYLQMYRIETSKVIETITPVIIDPFDAEGKFKPTATILEEMNR